MSVAGKTSILVVLALLCGVGAAYAPAPTFVVVAATLALGLWLLVWNGRPALAGPETSVGPPVSVTATEEGKLPRPLVTKLVSGYLLVVWLLLIVPLAAYTPRGGSTSGAAEAAASGKLSNQLIVISFGLVGSLFLPAATRRLDPAFRWVAALWALYLGWALISLYWSIYLPLTFRNVGAFILITVGSVGLGAGFYGRHPNGRDLFLRHLFVAGVLSALVILVPLPFRWQQYNLLDPSQRLNIAGNFTTFAARPVMCVMLAFVAAAMLGVRRWRGRDWFWVAVLVLPLLVLKARGPVVWAMMAFVIFYLLYRPGVEDRARQAGLLLVTVFGAVVGLFSGVFGPVVPYLARGDVEYTLTLSNRFPLWEVLLQEAAVHPWLGVGFAAFFSPDNLYRIEQIAVFSAVSAHNGFLSVVLTVGIVGLVILLAFFASAVAVALRRARRGDPLGWIALLFIAYYLALNLTNDLMTDYLEFPFVMTLMILALMAGRPMTGSPATPQRVPDMIRERVASPRRSTRTASSWDTRRAGE